MSKKEVLGKVRIEHEVLAGIAAAAAVRVEGVTRIIPGFVGLVEGIFGRTAPQHTVTVKMGESNVRIGLAVEVKYGSDIPQLAWEVQKTVKEAVENMTGIRVAGVDVEVRALRVDNG